VVLVGLVILAVVSLVAFLLHRIRHDDEMEILREEEEALQAEKEPNLYERWTPVASGSSGGYLSDVDEESEPLLV
jgi:hypothetical protein